MKRTKVENGSTKIVHMGAYTPDSKIVPSEIHKIEMPHKPPIKMKLLPQSPVGMANAQTSAKFIPQNKKSKQKKL